MKSENIKRKIAILAGLSISLTACGKNNSDEQEKETKANIMNTTAVVQEIDENEVKVESVEETTNEKGETVKVSEGITENGEKVKITETTNECGETIKVIETTNDKGETVKVTEKTNDKGETVKVTEKKDSNGNVTEKIEEVTEPKTEIKTEPKTEQVTTTKVNNNNIKTTTTQVTTKPVNTTKAVQTTAKPVVTTQAPTKPIKTSYNKYDLLDQDPDVAAAAFEKLSDQLCEELFNGYIVSDDYGITAGYEQAKVLLAALNYNQGIRPEVLGYEETLGEFSREDILRYGMVVDLPQEQSLYGSKVDFNKYMLDDNFANEIEDVTNKYFDWVNNGNYGPLDDKLNKYFATYNSNTVSNIHNFIEYYYMSRLDSETMEYYSDDLEKQLYQNNVLIPMYNSYEPYKGHSYTR